MNVRQLSGFIGTFALASAATFAITAAEYGDTSHPTRTTLVILVLIALHSLRYLRIWLSREIFLYLGFLAYSLLSLSWVNDFNAGVVTVPALINFSLVLILFSSLAACHDFGALISGMFVGSLAAVAFYSLTTGYPLIYPEDFSYNTIAGMYLSGFFITLMFGAHFRWRTLTLAVAFILLALIATTTSIKTNLGAILGIVGAGLLYFKLSVRSIIRSGIVIVLLAVGVFYVVASNQALTERAQNGFDRVSTGLAVLTNRESDSNGIGLETRQGWKNEGLKGWGTNPVFGYGMEAFRADFGITSHSTPIDLLYNAGLIGCGLFYCLLASIAWRLYSARSPVGRPLRARIAALLITYSFISLSGIMYYSPLLAIYLGVSSGILAHLERQAAARSRPPVLAAAFAEPAVLRG